MINRKQRTEIRNQNFRQRRGGFTLIETIIYLAIVSVILVSISYLILDILGGQTKNYAKQEVNYNLRFISNILTKDIKAAKNVNSLTSDTLVLTMVSDNITYNFDSVNKIITRQLGVGSPVTINTNQVEITGNFTNLSYLGRAKDVGAYLRVVYKNPSNLPDYNANGLADFSVELRGRR